METRGRKPDPRTTELGRYLAERREDLKWSLTDLAKASRVPLNKISRIEKGAPRPKILVLQLLARALGVHPDRLMMRAGWPAQLPTLVASERSPERSDMRKAAQFHVTPTERRELEFYLEFLRLKAQVLSRKK